MGLLVDPEEHCFVKKSITLAGELKVLILVSKRTKRNGTDRKSVV